MEVFNNIQQIRDILDRLADEVPIESSGSIDRAHFILDDIEAEVNEFAPNDDFDGFS